MGRLVTLALLVVSTLLVPYSNALQRNLALERNEELGLQVLAELEDELFGSQPEPSIVGINNVGAAGPNGIGGDDGDRGIPGRERPTGSGGQNGIRGQRLQNLKQGEFRTETSGKVITLDQIDELVGPLSIERMCCKVIVPSRIESITISIDIGCSEAQRRLRPDICEQSRQLYHMVQPECPQHHKTCCEGQVWFRRGCAAIRHLRKVVELIKAGAF